MSDCIECIGVKRSNGYGVRRFRNRTEGAHRAAWIEVHGPIPDGLHCCHKCDNRGCVNVDHLFLGTRKENMADAAVKGRIAKGSALPQAKLTEETAVFAMARLLAGESQGAVARAVGVARTTIWKLWNGKSWSHVFAEGG